jgi:hypothetical protein
LNAAQYAHLDHRRVKKKVDFPAALANAFLAHRHLLHCRQA